MSYSVNWTTKVIDIPIDDLELVNSAEYNLDMSAFHVEIRRLEWLFTGGLFSDQIIEYTKPKTLAGSTYQPFVEVINGYTFVFPTAADAVNLIGANTNLFLLEITPANGVSIRPNNSAGNTIAYVDTGSTTDPNEVIDMTVYNNGVLVSARVRHFATPAEAIAAIEGTEVASYQMVATATGECGEMTSYRKVRIL